MIPLKLSIQGIYSYQEQQEIDFSQLTQSQLFGIFGATGSGKSTILEAISYSLYGESERLNKRDNRGYNMMNLKSNQMLIDFEFEADEKRYRFLVKGKRNSKNFEQISSFSRSALEWNGDDWVPIEVNSIEEITGLSYDNFKRTIIIPQGKFQEFLQLTETDRTRMLKEIFKLEKYELFYKTASLEKKNQIQITRLETMILQLEAVTLETIEELRIEQIKVNLEIEAHKENLAKKEKSLQKLDELKQLFEKIEKQLLVVQELQKNVQNIKEREETLKQYESCLIDFKPSLDRKKELSESLESLTKNVESKKEAQSQSKKDLAIAEGAFKEINQQYLNREKFLKKAEELANIIHIKQSSENLTVLKDRVFKGDEILSGVNIHIRDIRTKLAEKNKEIKTLRKNQPDLDLLMKIKEWFDNREKLEVEKEREHKQLQDLLSQEQILQKKKLDILKPTSISSTQYNLDSAKLIEILTLDTQKLKENLTETEKTREAFLAKVQLKHFTEGLEEGKPCPLCGATHHPDIVEIGNVDYELNKIKTQIQHIQTDIQNNGKTILQLETLSDQITFLKNQIQDFREKYNLAESALDRHISTFTWKKYSIQDHEKVAKSIADISVINAKISQLNQDKEAFETTIEKEEKKRELYSSKLDELKEQRQKVEIDFQSTMKSLSLVSFENYKHLNNAQIEKEVLEQKEQYNQVENLYQTYDQRIQKLRANVAMLKGEIAELDKQEQDITTRIVKLNQQISTSLTNSAFPTLKAVEEILDLDLNIGSEKDAITQFHQAYNSANTTLADLKAQVEGKDFDTEKFQHLTIEIGNLKQEISDKMVHAGGLKKELEQKEAEWKEKEKLQQDLDKLLLRAEDLKTLKSMFNRSGFVNYVSTIFLHNLSQAANKRFAKLTKGSLNLEATSNNSFQVRDYLNNGQVRSIKTLSGGQTFQAALSLALALADEVQQQVKAKQNFFFLDEGFGSQDKNSLQVIFETLKSLRKEDRIVGIISHVEELQQEINTYLYITNEDQTGSRVEESWT